MSQMTVLNSESDSIARGVTCYATHLMYITCWSPIKLTDPTAESKCKYAPMQFHFFSNAKGNCSLCDVYHTFWQLCPVLDYHGNITRQPSNAYRIHLQQGKSSGNICKSMSNESEESWYILKSFSQWYVAIILFYVTTICCNLIKLRPENISGQRIIHHIYQITDCCSRSGNCLI